MLLCPFLGCAKIESGRAYEIKPSPNALVILRSGKYVLFAALFAFLFHLVAVERGSLKVLIIALKKSTDKIQIKTVHMKALGIESYSFIYGLDGKVFLMNSPNNDKLEWASEIKGLSINFNVIPQNNGPQFGAFISHLMAFNYIIEHNINEPLMIL